MTEPRTARERSPVDSSTFSTARSAVAAGPISIRSVSSRSISKKVLDIVPYPLFAASRGRQPRTPVDRERRANAPAALQAPAGVLAHPHQHPVLALPRLPVETDEPPAPL